MCNTTHLLATAINIIESIKTEGGGTCQSSLSAALLAIIGSSGYQSYSPSKESLSEQVDAPFVCIYGDVFLVDSPAWLNVGVYSAPHANYNLIKEVVHS